MPCLFEECCDFFDEDFRRDGFVEEVFHGQPRFIAGDGLEIDADLTWRIQGLLFDRHT